MIPGGSVDQLIDVEAARLDAYLAFPGPDAPRARTPNTTNERSPLSQAIGLWVFTLGCFYPNMPRL